MKGFELFSIDQKAANDGIWVEVPTEEAICPKFKIIQWEGRAYLAGMQKVAKALKAKFGRKVLKNEHTLDILREICISLLVVDWQNVYDDDDNLVEFNRDKLRELLNDESCGDQLVKWIVEKAKDIDLFRQEDMESDIKNS
jgi:hypothetical protein